MEERTSVFSLSNEETTKSESKEDVPINEDVCDNVDEEEDKANVEEKGVFDTKAKKLTIFCLSLYWFIVSCAYSMIEPFFPGEASKKGANVTTTGLIFAVFPLVMFVVSPIYGILIPKTGPKTILVLGLLLEGGTQILFGFLHLMPDGNIFIIFCFLIRIVSAFGAAATAISSLTLLTQTFRENISAAMGIFETFGGFGMMAGPPIGGFLYAVGGFKLPFLVIGSIALISIIPLHFALPADKIDSEPEGSKNNPLLQALKTPAIDVIMLGIFAGGMSLSFLDPTLQKHLQEPFHLNSTEVGLMFFISPAIYTMITPFLGMITRHADTRALISVGAVVVGISYVLLGPSPFLPSSIFPSTLWLNGIALAILGLGIAPFFVPALEDMNNSAAVYGLPDDIGTQSALSAMFNSMFEIGCIAGPTFGSILVQRLNFAWASGIFGLYLIATGIFIFIFTVCERRTKRYKRSKGILCDESKPLLALDLFKSLHVTFGQAGEEAEIETVKL